MKNYLGASVSFGEYKALIELLVSEGKTTGPKQSESLANFTRLNHQRMNRLGETIELNDDTKAILRANRREQIWLVITEAWCGDAAQNIPIIEKIAAESDIIQTRYTLRDENPELIDRFLTFGARSIPKVIALDADSYEILWTWGGRPKAAQDLFFGMHKDGAEKSAIMETLQRWYNEDKGRSIQAEFVSLLTGKDGQLAAASAS
ncbi:MAG: thioredoxin family protein [Pyrinomonadaceae bacterium]